MAWSADGQLLADRQLRGVTPASTSGTYAAGRSPRCFRDIPATSSAPQFAHTGYLLATTSWDGTTRLWDAASGEPLATATGSALGFALDDRRLAFGAQGRSASGTWPRATNVARSTRPCSAIAARGETPPAMSGRVQPRRPAAGDRRRGWRPPVGGRHGSGGRPPQERRLRDRPVSPRRPKPHHLRHEGPVSLANPSRSRSRGGCNPRRATRSPPRIAGPSGMAKRMVARSSNAGDDRQRSMPGSCSSIRAILTRPGAGRAALDSGENRRMTTVAVSPDGRWLAVGGWKEAGVRVWDLPGAGSSDFETQRSRERARSSSASVPTATGWFRCTAPIRAQVLPLLAHGTWETGQRANLNCDGECPSVRYSPPMAS